MISSESPVPEIGTPGVSARDLVDGNPAIW